MILYITIFIRLFIQVNFICLIGRAYNWALPWDTSLMLDIVVLVIHWFQLIHRVDGTLEANPFECRLTTVLCVALFNKPYWLKDICNIIQSTNLGFQLVLLLFVFDLSAFSFNQVSRLTAWNLLSSLLKTYDFLPCHKEVDELLAQNTQWLFFLILLEFVSSIFWHLLEYLSFSFIRLNLNERWHPLGRELR